MLLCLWVIKMTTTSNNKADTAYEIIKREILTLDLLPGSHLKELELSKRLKISRTPLREAMHRLTSEGFIDQQDNQMSTVSKMSVNKFVEIYQIRDCLELLSSRLAALNWVSESEITEAEEILKHQMDAAITIQKVDSVEKDKEYLKYDKMFHLKMAEMSRSELLYNEVIRMLDLYYRYNYFTVFRNSAVMNVNEHLAILDAVKSRNPHRSETAMKEHLQWIRERILIGISSSIDLNKKSVE